MDELELACQLDQWRVHGTPDLDPMPGYFLSPFMKKVCVIMIVTDFFKKLFQLFTLAAGSRIAWW